MHVLNIKFACKAGKRDQVVSILDPDMLIQVEKEPATLLYLMHVEDSDPNAIWFWMMYTGQDGFVEHTKSDVDKRVGETFGPMIESVEFHQLTLVGGKGSPL